MTDELMAALNPTGGKLTEDQVRAIKDRWIELEQEALHSPETRSEIFKAYVKRVVYDNDFRKTLKAPKAPAQDEQIAEELETLGNEAVIPITSKKCSQCGGLAGDGWKYQDQKSFRIICPYCQERDRVQNRKNPAEQRCLF
jgi:DNA-directed RNA polymerase subunit RPC12/RpoP